MKITSKAFEHNGNIPSKYTCDGDPPAGGVNPPLEIFDVPPEARSLVLIMDDPDSPRGTWGHWLVWDIPPVTKEIREGEEPEGTKGRNSWGNTGYGGPCPHEGVHHYIFTLYALDMKLSLPEDTPKKDIEDAMTDHILGEAELIGLYKRNP